MYLQILYTQEIDLWATSEAKHINEWIWSKKKYGSQYQFMYT